MVDFDGRGGITSLLNKNTVGIGKDDMSIAEMLLVAEQQGSVRDAYDQTVIDTGLENSKYWDDNGGSLYLIPSKPSLDSIIPESDPDLLRTLLHDLEIPDDFIVLIDTGSDNHCVVMGIAAADIVFLPMLLSRQDVHPTIETLRTVFNAQKRNGGAVLGGMIVNQSGGTEWEQGYIDRYIQLFDRFQHESKIMSATDSLFIELSQSRIIKKGTFMDWSLRESFLKTAQTMAYAVNAVEIAEYGVKI